MNVRRLPEGFRPKGRETALALNKLLPQQWYDLRAGFRRMRGANSCRSIAQTIKKTLWKRINIDTFAKAIARVEGNEKKKSKNAAVVAVLLAHYSCSLETAIATGAAAMKAEDRLGDGDTIEGQEDQALDSVVDPLSLSESAARFDHIMEHVCDDAHPQLQSAALISLIPFINMKGVGEGLEHPFRLAGVHAIVACIWSLSGRLADPSFAAAARPQFALVHQSALRALRFVHEHLGEIDLSGCNLAGAKLKGAQLLRANLSEANLVQGDLRGALLAHANLRGTDLSCADLANSTLCGADLEGANLSEAILTEAHLATANLNHTILAGAKLEGSTLVSPDGGFFFKANFSNAVLRGVDLSRACLGESDLTDADLYAVKLRNADLSKAQLVRTFLVDADLRGADLTGADLRDADLRDADLSDAIGLTRTMLDSTESHKGTHVSYPPAGRSP